VVDVFVLAFVVIVVIADIADRPENLALALSKLFVRIPICRLSAPLSTWSHGCIGDGFWLFVCEENDTGYEDENGDKDKEQGPRFVGFDFGVEDEGVKPACGGVHAVKDRNDEGRVVDFETAVETYDLEDGGDDEKDYSEYRGSMTELISWIFMREGTREQFDSCFCKDQTTTGETTTTGGPSYTQRPSDLSVVLWCNP